MTTKEIIEKLMVRINKLRAMYGEDICTNPNIDGNIIRYTFMPDDITGYTVEIDTDTMVTRHRGLSRGCFWTEWTPLNI